MKRPRRKKQYKVKTEPYPFQKKGVRKVHHFGGRALIADEMGLGKTLQSLMFMIESKASPTIVVCPASLKLNWELEVMTHLGMSSVILWGRKPPKGFQFAESTKIVMVNYEILAAWLKPLRRLKPKLIVIDEVHRIKNRDAKCTRNTKLLCKGVPYVLGLSGTPLLNRPSELWPILNILRPDIWDAFMPYGYRHCQPRRTRWGMTYKGARRLPELNRKLGQYCMIRRLKKNVLKDLPEKTRHVVPLPLSNQREYDRAEKDFLHWLAQQSKAKALRAKKAQQITKMGYLKQLVAELKMKAVFDWVDSFLAESDGKLILFAIHRSIIRQLHDRYKGISVVLHGKLTGRKKQAAVNQFQNDERIRLLFGNLQTAGVGWNLTAASDVGICEIGWNPALHLQAEDRAHRIKQLRNVVCHYLIAPGTIEEKLCNILHIKQGNITAILDGEEVEDNQRNVFDQLISELTGNS